MAPARPALESRTVTADPSRSALPQRMPGQVVAPRIRLASPRLTERWFAFLLALPALLGIFVVVLFPLLYSLWLSFTDVNLLRSTGPALEVFGVRVPLFRWIGLQNYLRILDDPLYWSSLWRTLYFVAAFVIEAALVGMAMALVLNERFPGRPLIRSVLLIPWSLSRVVVGLLWIGILDFEFGALNGLLHNLGLIDSSIAFFKHGFSALNVLVSVYMWNQAPFATLLFLAGMQSISLDLYAAAAVDGAGYWQRFRYVTLPALRPIVFLVVVLATVNGFLMLDLIYVLTMGGPGHDTTTISWLGFQTTFAFFKFGPGTAILYTLTALCLLLTFVYHRLILARFEAES
jgi:multiple sugar transport system permease protein